MAAKIGKLRAMKPISVKSLSAVCFFLVCSCGASPDSQETTAVADPSGRESAATAVKPSPAALTLLEAAGKEPTSPYAWATCSSFRVEPHFRLTVFSDVDANNVLLLVDWKTDEGNRIQQILAADSLEWIISRAGGEFRAKFKAGGQSYALEALEAGAKLTTPTDDIPMSCVL